MVNGKLAFRLRTSIALALSGFWLVCLAGGMPSLPAALAASTQVVELNNEGVKALNAGNFQLAITKFEQALKLDPSYQLAKENLAIAYNNYGLQLQNNPKEAIKQFHKALYLNPNNATTLQNLEGIITLMRKNPKSFKDRVELADQARLAGDFQGAIIEYKEALRLKDDANIHMKLGDVFRVRDEVDKAIEEYKAATRTGDTAELQVKLGQAYQAKKDLPNAIAAYGRALQLKPDDTEVLDALVTGWEEALKENPTAPENHIGLGQAFQYRGDFAQAEAEYKQALFFDKNNATAKRLLAGLAEERHKAAIAKHVNAGVDLQTRKLYDQAIAEYMKALEEDPRNATIWVNIGSAYQQKEDFDRAVEAYNKALALDPNNQAAKQGIKASQEAKEVKQIASMSKDAADLFKLGKFDEAIAKYQELIKADPHNSAAYFSMGATFQAKKDLDQAIAAYRQAISFDPKNEDYKKALEAAYETKAAPILERAVKKHQEKDYASAIDLYQQVIALRPKNATLWFNLAGAYYAREDYAKARDAYQKAFEIDPKGQVNNLYLMAVIDEHYDRATQAIDIYKKYLAEAPTGQYAGPAKDRIKALTADPKATIKIKSEAELAKIKEAEDAFTKAVALQKEKKWEEAITLYKKAIDLQPQEPAYAYALGTLFQQRSQEGDIDIAINWYQQAIDQDPKNKDYPNALQSAFDQKAAPIVDAAVKLQTAGEVQAAINKYQEAVAIVPKNAGLWTNLGTAYQNADNFQAAREAYQKGLDLDPKSQVGNLYFIGAIDEHFGQGTKALQEYQKYLATAPTGQYAGLAKDRVKVLSANPNNTVKLQTSSEIKTARDAADSFDKAIKLHQEQKFDEALPLYQKAVELMPKEAAYAYALGTCYQAKNDLDSAAEWYKKAIALDPKNKDYPKLLNAAYELKAAPIMDEAVKKHGAGDLAGAIELYQKGLAILPNNGGGWTNLAAAYQASDDFGRARDAFQKALEVDPKGQVDNWYFIGLINEHFGQGAKALQDYQKYVSAAPNRQYTRAAQERIKVLAANPVATQKLTTTAEARVIADASKAFDEGVKLQQAQKYDEALAEYQKALQLIPKEAAYPYAIGTVYQAKGDFDSAIEWYKKALALAPKNKQYQDLLKAAYEQKAAPTMAKAVELHGAGKLAEAIEQYQQALAITPNNAHGWTNLAAAYQGMDDFARARDSYQKAVTIDPKTEVDNHYFIALIDEHFGKGPQALQGYQKYVASAPRGQYVALAQERIKALTANPNATQKLATQAQQKASAEADAAFQNAVKLQQENKFDEAIAEYQKAIQIAPNFDSYWYSLGTAYQAKGDVDQAMNAYGKASSINPKEPAYKQLIKQLKQSKAAPLLESAFKKQTTKDDKGNYDLVGAIADYEAALKIDDDATTRMNLGTALQGSNNLQRALSEYKKALQMDPKQCDAYYYLGTLYEQMKQPALAIGEYRKCVQCAPTGANAAAAKGRIRALGGR